MPVRSSAISAFQRNDRGRDAEVGIFRGTQSLLHPLLALLEQFVDLFAFLVDPLLQRPFQRGLALHVGESELLHAFTGAFPPLGESLKQALESLPKKKRIDLGCALRHGSFDVTYPGRERAIEIRCSEPSTALAYLFFGLLHRLQVRATVPAIHYPSYMKNLRG